VLVGAGTSPCLQCQVVLMVSVCFVRRSMGSVGFVDLGWQD
jgi:hypothetical protein